MENYYFFLAMLLFFVGPYFYAWMTIMSICGTIIMMSIAAAAADNKMLLSSSHGDMRQVLHYHLIAYFYQLPKSNNAMSDNISNINLIAAAINNPADPMNRHQMQDITELMMRCYQEKMGFSKLANLIKWVWKTPPS